MQLLEYQSKNLLKTAGVAIPQGHIITSQDPSDPATLTYPLVLKSQVPIGGRGKLGGIKVVTNPDEFLATFPLIKALEIKGHKPESILAEEALDIDRELYLALRVNRDARRIDVVASHEGGVEIESHTSSVISLPYDDKTTPFEVAKQLDIDESACQELLKKLHNCMTRNDLLLLEINPLVVTKTNELIAADAKMLLDDNALFKYPDYASEAVSSSVLPLGGTIGVIANGAGMAMSTMDTIYAAGGRPANFLDIGGGTGEDVFIKNLREITSLPHVSSIIINIFAGITRCDDIARGIIAAKRYISDLVPLYIRLEGTNRDEAAKLLEEAGIDIQPDLKRCVEKALESQPTNEAGGKRVARKRAAPTEARASRVEDGANSVTELASSDRSGQEQASSIFMNQPAIVQGITGHHGSFHTKGMLDAGTDIVAGVTPGKGGQTVHDVPVYNSVQEAVDAHDATTSVVFVPPKFAKNAVIEAIDAGISLIVIITEGIPVHDMLAIHKYAVDKIATIVGPNCPGFIIPGSHKLGIIAAHITTPGTTAIISRSGTLTYELAAALTKKGIGQRIVLGIGGDPIQGMNFTEALELCEHDDIITQIVLVGEIGGTSEQIAANYIETHVTKPVYGLVVGHSLPAGQQFGHAGAIVDSLGESAKEKTNYMAAKGLHMSATLDELIESIDYDN